MFVFLIFVITLLFFVYLTSSLKTLNHYSSLKKTMTIAYAAFFTFMQIPMMEIIISNFFLDFSKSNSIIKILIYTLASINSLFLICLTIFLNKLLIIRIPCSSVPWSASNTQLHFMKAINKILLVIGHLYLSAFGEN